MAEEGDASPEHSLCGLSQWPAHPELGSRCFGDTEGTVSDLNPLTFALHCDVLEFRHPGGGLVGEANG